MVLGCMERRTIRFSIWRVLALTLATCITPARAQAQAPAEPAPAKQSPVQQKSDTAKDERKAPAAPRRAAQPSMASRLEWRWPKFTPYQFGISLGQGGLAVASLAIPGQTNWGAGGSTNALDGPARDALRITDKEMAYYARDFSDIGLVALLNQRLVDSLFVTWWYHDKGSTALQMALIDLQAISFAAGVQGFVAGIIGRERPYVSSICGASPEKESDDCAGNNRQRSFFSGHTTLAFTLAGLTCAHHINLPIYGGGAADVVPCVGTMLVAGGVGMLRVASDQHYVTDVMAGAAFGTAVGFSIPYLFHYAWEIKSDENPALKKAGIDSVSLMPNPTGFSVGGLF